MKIKYEGLDGETYSKHLKEIKVTGILLHSTPDEKMKGGRMFFLKKCLYN